MPRGPRSHLRPVAVATAQPIRHDGAYIARHGRGYSSFERQANGIALGAEDMEELSTLLAVNLPVTIQ